MHLYVYVYACFMVYIIICVYMYLCMYTYMYNCIKYYVYLSIRKCATVRVYVCMYVCKYICLYTCMFCSLRYCGNVYTVDLTFSLERLLLSKFQQPVTGVRRMGVAALWSIGCPIRTDGSLPPLPFPPPSLLPRLIESSVAATVNVPNQSRKERE